MNKTTVLKLLQTVDEGLCSGVGEPIPGEMCVEAAVCYALGLPHGDDPGCVGEAVRRFVIELNDGNWSSNEARAAGLRKLAVAQLGSDQINQYRFLELVALKTVQRLGPLLFEELAKLAEINEDREAMESAGRACAEVASLQEAVTVLNRNLGRGIYIARDRGRALYFDHALSYYPSLGLTFSIIQARTIVYTIVNSLNRILDPTSYHDETLKMAADVCLEVLVETESPGCQWLWLCKTPEAQDPNRGAFGARACGEIDGYGGLHSQ